MKIKPVLLLILSSALLFAGCRETDQGWLTTKHGAYTLFYTRNDEPNRQDYDYLIESGIDQTEGFFDSPYRADFDVYIHPDRHSLDSAWQKDWNMPGFQSECWMVASGVANKLDMISPRLWDTEACEHSYRDTLKTQQLVNHELVHVYHGQLNSSPDFSETEGIDWFIEGLATYVSGQTDSSRISEVKKAVDDGEIPATLDSFWTGKNRYGLSGSVVMYIDNHYGRSKLKELLPVAKKTEILTALQTSEQELLNGWKDFVQNL